MTRKNKIKQEKLDKERRYPKTKRSRKEVAKFLVISLLLMIVVDQLIFGGQSPRFEQIKKEYYAEQALKKKKMDEAIEYLLPPELVFPQTVLPEDGSEYFEAPDGGFKKELLLGKHSSAKIPRPTVKPPHKSKKQVKAWRKGDKRVKIAIVIDDVGMNLKQSRAAIALPKQVTLAFLPYAKKVRSMAKTARKRGHELIIHTPMEAMDAKISLGSLALKKGMSPVAFNTEFEKITKSFDGYVGINNHMGSRLTQDKEAMGHLMRQLKRRNLFFLDSKTIHTSIAAKAARVNGIPYAERDVFLDHEDTPEFIVKALRNVERIARERGSVIAIGHPKVITMRALQKWIPTLSARGYELVPLSALLRNRNKTVEDNIIQVKAKALPSNDKKSELSTQAKAMAKIETAAGVEKLGKEIVTTKKTYQKLFLSDPTKLEFEMRE